MHAATDPLESTVVVGMQVRDHGRIETADMLPHEGLLEDRGVLTRVDEDMVSTCRQQQRIALPDIHHDETGAHGKQEGQDDEQDAGERCRDDRHQPTT